MAAKHMTRAISGTVVSQAKGTDRENALTDAAAAGHPIGRAQPEKTIENQ
jgi:hypothetical protein